MPLSPRRHRNEQTADHRRRHSSPPRAWLGADIAEAKRMGGGRSIGAQRQVTPAPAPERAHRRAEQRRPAPAHGRGGQGRPAPPRPRPSGASRWLGPIAGLAAGLGLAALMSHLGLSEAFGELPPDRAGRRRRHLPRAHAAARKPAQPTRSRCSTRAHAPGRVEPADADARRRGVRARDAAAPHLPQPRQHVTTFREPLPAGLRSGALRRAGQGPVPQAAGRLRPRRSHGAGRSDDARDVRRGLERDRRSAARTRRPRVDAPGRRGARSRHRRRPALDERALHAACCARTAPCCRRNSRKRGTSSSPSTTRRAGCSPASSSPMQWPDPRRGARRASPTACLRTRTVGAREARAVRRPRVRARGRPAVRALAHRRRRHASPPPPPARRADLDAHALPVVACPAFLADPSRWNEFVREEGDAELRRRAEGARAHAAVVRRGDASRRRSARSSGQRVADAGRRLLAFPAVRRATGSRDSAGSYVRDEGGSARARHEARRMARRDRRGRGARRRTCAPASMRSAPRRPGTIR